MHPLTPKRVIKLNRWALALVLVGALGCATASGSEAATAGYHQQLIEGLVQRCGRPPTQAIDQVERRGGIYRWRDSQGRWHFTDRPPPSAAEGLDAADLSAQYGVKRRFFRLYLSAPDGQLPPLLQDRLQAEVNALFTILADLIETRRLRQVDLQIKIFNERTGYLAYSRHSGGFANRTVGYYNTLRNEAVISRQRQDDATRAVTRHEATHAVVAGLFGLIPSWLNEGLAEYFEDLALVGGQRVVEPDRYWLQLLRQQQSQLPPLASYFDLKPSAWYGQQAELNYAMGWGLVYFLFDDRQSRLLLGQLLSDLADARCQPFDVGDYLHQRIVGGLPELQRQWQQWLQQPLRAHYY